VKGGVIILDGPDAAGKTTLAEAIKRRSGSRAFVTHQTLIKNDRSMWKSNFMAYYKASCQARMEDMGIIDRGWMSENIYASVYRNGSNLRYDVRCLDRMLMAQGAIYVICAPKPESAVARLAKMKKEREEMYEPDDRALMVAQRFYDLGRPSTHVINCYSESRFQDYVRDVHMKAVKNGMRGDFYAYDIDEVPEDKVDQLADALIEVARMHRNDSLPPWLHESPARRNFVGNWEGNVLFVGDRTNPNKSKVGLWPFVDFGASSRIISRCLAELSFDETCGLWTNANDEDNQLPEIFDHCKNIDRIICLGKESTRVLSDMPSATSIPIHVVHHPAYAQRFDKVSDFKKQLEKALA
jgi:hypothetical protein